MSDDRIIARIAAELAEGNVLDGLTRRLAPTDLQSLMLHVYQQRSARRTPADLLAQFERSAMVRPSTGDARALLTIERIAYECAGAFEAVELAPVSPLGVNRILGQIDQNNCLATARNAEVSADPTTAKAMECARRRRAGEKGTIKLCARSRQLRLQPVDLPGYSPHFGIFSMVTAGRDRGSLEFEVESLVEQLAVYLTLLGRLREHGYAIGDIEVQISDTDRDERRIERARSGVIGPLAEQFAGVTFKIDMNREQARNYYSGLCLSLWAANASGKSMNLADGGFTDWTRRLLSNAKERLLISGLGIELLVKLFRAAQG
jgi:hypothetical protein